jgi:hypothetical protein
MFESAVSPDALGARFHEVAPGNRAGPHCLREVAAAAGLPDGSLKHNGPAENTDEATGS